MSEPAKLLADLSGLSISAEGKVAIAAAMIIVTLLVLGLFWYRRIWPGLEFQD